MTAAIALQLYTLREALSDDFHGVIRKVAEMGYVGIEPAPSTLFISARAAAVQFDDLGLVVPSIHAPLPIGDESERVFDVAAALGTTNVVSGLGPESYASLDLIQRSCEMFNEAAEGASKLGMTIGMHNHWWEFQQVEGRHAYEVILENLDPRVFLQIDTYWVETAGCDAAQILRKLGPRAPMLHIKDGPAVRDEPMVPVGQGILDFDRIVRAAGDHVEWMIVEIDWAAMDMIEAVELSYQFMVSEGMAWGRVDVAS
jgi:sugar phosphate isomerase/epimerase